MYFTDEIIQNEHALDILVFISSFVNWAQKFFRSSLMSSFFLVTKGKCITAKKEDTKGEKKGQKE